MIFKENKIMKRIISIFTAIATAAFVLTGCSDSQIFTAKNYRFESADIKSITVNAIDREININISYDGNIRINYHESEKEYYEITNIDGVLTIAYTDNKNWSDYIGTKPDAKYRKIDIAIPDNVISNLTATTTNARIAVKNLTVKNAMMLTSNGGDILADKINIGSALQLKTKNGNITGSVVGSIDDFVIKCTVKKGECNLPANKPTGNKTLTADCNNGDVNIAFSNIADLL